MPPESTSFLKRFLYSLVQRASVKVRLGVAYGLGFLGIFIFGGVLYLLFSQLYKTLAGSSLGIGRVEFLQGTLLLLVALLGLCLIGFAFWLCLKIQKSHLAEIEQEAVFTRSIIAASPDAILTVDVNGVILSHNPTTCSMFGYEANRLNGQKISKLIPQRHFLHDVTTLGRGAFLAFGQRENFLTFPIEVAVAETNPHQGRRTFIVLIHDASERRHSHDTLHHISLSVSSTTGEAFVRTLLQQLSQVLQNDFAFIVEREMQSDSPVCALMIAERGRIRSKSDHSLEGTAFGEVLNQGFTAIQRGVREAFPNDEILNSLGAESFVGLPLQDHLRQTVGLIGVISRRPVENVGVAKQTLQIFAARAAAEIARKKEAEELVSEKERLHGDYTTMRDTAERDRKRYEEDIAAEQEMLAVTLRSIREGCITTNTSGCVIMVNPVAEELTGWTQREAMGRHLDEILHLVHRRNRRLIPADLLLFHPEQIGAQLILTARDQTERIIEASAAPIRNRNEKVLGTVLVIRDVTIKSRDEEERHKAEKLESLGLAAGGIAHDFNNLLTAIIGNLSLALMAADGTTRDRVEASKKASLRAQDLAQQLLTFAKGGAPIKKTASMRQLVLDTVGFSLSGANIRSSCLIPEDLWPVDIDAGQISQVISNLAVNASQAMLDGGVIHVHGENLIFTDDNAPLTLRAGRYIKIVVRDEGPGIPEEIQKKIFDPYFTTKPKGSGLGLATSYSIVKNHDGLIRLDSAPGAGATFTIYLPASDKEITSPETPLPEVARMQKKGRVLVLDDEEVICELVDCALTPLGFEVASSYTADDTLRLYKENLESGTPFDVVIMDLTIPGGMGGKEAVKKLREIDPQAKAIVSSGYAMDPIMSRFKDYGFTGVIAKPYDIAELERIVGEVIASRVDS